MSENKLRGIFAGIEAQMRRELLGEPEPTDGDPIYEALRSYRSSRWRDNDGEPMELLDILGPNEPSVEPAREELHRIADHIAGELADVAARVPVLQPEPSPRGPAARHIIKRAFVDAADGVDASGRVVIGLDVLVGAFDDALTELLTPVNPLREGAVDSVSRSAIDKGGV